MLFNRILNTFANIIVIVFFFNNLIKLSIINEIINEFIA